MGLTDLLGDAAIIEHCCQVVSAKAPMFPLPLSVCGPNDSILHVNFDLWTNMLTTAFLESLTVRYSHISLEIKQGSYYSPETIDLLSRTLGSKLVALTLNDCHMLHWKGQVKSFVDKSVNLEIVNFSRNHWVDDSMMEQLTGKLSKTLKCLILENSSITNTSLYHMSKKLKSLRLLHLIYCSNIDDKGLQEITYKIPLQYLNISHNQKITQKSLVEVISALKQLNALNVTNCINIGDSCVDAIFSQDAMMKRKSGYNVTLTSLEFRALPEVTAEALLSLANNCGALKLLDLRDCDNIDLSYCLNHISTAKNISSLFLGPSSIAVQSETFFASIRGLCPALEVLHLISIPNLKEQDLCEILRLSVNLSELFIDNISFGTLAVEALVNSCPQVKSLTITNNSKIQDKDIRCLTVVCLQIKSLTISNCPNITSNAFVRGMLLRTLTHLDISTVQIIDSQSFFAGIQHSPIATLVLDNIRFAQSGSVTADPFLLFFRTLSEFPALSHSLRKISMQRCHLTSLLAIDFVLDHFIRLTEFDVTDALYVAPAGMTLEKHISGIRTPNPFLVSTVRLGVTKFSVDRNCQVYTQFFTVMKKLRESLCANKIKYCFRAFKRYAENVLSERAQQQQLHLFRSCVRIQSVVRMFKWRKLLRHRLQCKALIAKTVYQFLHQRQCRQNTRMKVHYRKKLLKTSFLKLNRFSSASKAVLSIRASSIFSKVYTAIVGKFFYLFCKLYLRKHYKRQGHIVKAYTSIQLLRKYHATHQQRLEVEDRVEILWKVHLLKRVLASWKTIISHTEREKLLILRKYFLAIDIPFHNSIRQRQLQQKADHFRQRRLLSIAWSCMAFICNRKREIDLLVPFAVKYERFRFYQRVMKVIVTKMNEYRVARHFKYQAKKKAEAFHKQHLKEIGVKKLHYFLQLRKRFHEGINRSKKHYIDYRLTLVLRVKMGSYLRRIEYLKRVMMKYYRNYQSLRCRIYMRFWGVFYNNRLYWKHMTAKAVGKYHLRIERDVFGALKDYMERLRTDAELHEKLAYRGYLMRLCGKIIGGLKRNRIENMQYILSLQSNLQEQLGDDTTDNPEDATMHQFMSMYNVKVEDDELDAGAQDMEDATDDVTQDVTDTTDNATELVESSDAAPLLPLESSVTSQTVVDGISSESAVVAPASPTAVISSPTALKKVLSPRDKQLAARKALEEKVQKRWRAAIRGITLFQSIVRGRQAYMSYQKYKISMEYSALLIQAVMRRYLARKHYLSLVKKHYLKSTINEYKELELMRDAELESQLYEYHIKCIIDIQRVYRGFAGRDFAKKRYIEMKRLKAMKEYDDIQNTRQQYEVNKRLAIAREILRNKSAVVIQARVRGILARKQYVKIKQQVSYERNVILIQSHYRRHLAQMQLLSMIRDFKMKDHYIKARKSRGLLLRVFRCNTRRKQFRVGRILNFLGVDPMSFHYNPIHSASETWGDLMNLYKILSREYELWKEYKTNKVDRIKARRKRILDLNCGFAIGDAVKIIEPSHPYHGYTGSVARIDTTVAGLPLYEIRLDHFLYRLTYVTMTTDAIQCYENTQPLCHVEKRPFLETLVFKTMYGLKPEDPLYKRKNVDAVLAIQRCYRIYRARQIVARMRYEHWQRSINIQESLIHQLSDSNALTYVGNVFLGLFGLGANKISAFTEILHPILPMKLLLLLTTNSEPKQIVQDEMERRYQARMVFLNKFLVLAKEEREELDDGEDELLPEPGDVLDNGIFVAGRERLTTLRMMKLLAFMSYGVVLNSGVNLLHYMSGRRLLRNLSRNQRPLMSGVSRYAFSQFATSPHVRYAQASLYQGYWSGIPLFTPLAPHGEGMIMFFDCWGISREDKVLYITVESCSNLSFTSYGTCDPYCEIICNGTTLQTSVKLNTINPVYNESFEIAVTNPEATVLIMVKERNFGVLEDNFLGQCIIDLAALADKKAVRKKIPLKGEDLYSIRPSDNGDITLQLLWTDRKYEDDLVNIDRENKACLRLQCWARRIIASKLLNTLREDREKLLKLVRQAAVKITNTCRIRLARKEYKRRQRRVRAAIRIQRKIRVYLAKKVFERLRLEFRMAKKIQQFFRHICFSLRLQRLKVATQQLKSKGAINIQRFYRGYRARRHYYSGTMHEYLVKIGLIKGDPKPEVAEDTMVNLRSETIPEDETVNSGEGEDIGASNSFDENAADTVETQHGEDQHQLQDSSLEKSSMESLDATDNLVQASSSLETDNNGWEQSGRNSPDYQSESMFDLIPHTPAYLPDEPVCVWILTYGVDPVYGLKRNRRIVDRAFRKMLTMRYVRFVTFLGVAYLDHYPVVDEPLETHGLSDAIKVTASRDNNDSIPVVKAEDSTSLVQASFDTYPFRDPNKFGSFFIPAFRPICYHKREAIRLLHKTLHTGVLNIHTALDKRESVFAVVTTIQCAFRMFQAKKMRQLRVRLIRSIIRLQRLFRQRSQHHAQAARKIQNFFHLLEAKRLLIKMKVEFEAAITLQCAWRVYQAYRRWIDMHSVKRVVVLGSSDSAAGYGADKAFDYRDNTFWVANTTDMSEVRVELGKVECISNIWIMTSTFSSSAQYVLIEAITDPKEPRYEIILPKTRLVLLRGLRWHKFRIDNIMARYLRFSFYENYGHRCQIAVRHIRFITSKEISAKINFETPSLVFREGPILGHILQEKLIVKASGWPKPSFQWYRNNRPITGATQPEYLLNLMCKASSRKRNYRCAKCKMVSKEVPINAFRIHCRNCAYETTLKDIDEYANIQAKIHANESLAMVQREHLLQARSQLIETLLPYGVLTESMITGGTPPPVANTSSDGRPGTANEAGSRPGTSKSVKVGFSQGNRNDPKQPASNVIDPKKKALVSKVVTRFANAANVAPAKRLHKVAKTQSNEGAARKLGFGPAPTAKKGERLQSDNESVTNDSQALMSVHAQQPEAVNNHSLDQDHIARYVAQLQNLDIQISQIDEFLANYKIERYKCKQITGLITNRYQMEGIYFCRVSNMRGSSIQIIRKTRPIVVVIEFPKPFPIYVQPLYIPRHRNVIRKTWTIYSSLYGTFIHGKVNGIVTIQFSDGSYYEGPYVGDEWLDAMGRVRREGRSRNHYGIFKCGDGRVFEGPLVDNHFNPYNLQDHFKLTLPNGEVYEGMFCDEQYHGHGLYHYSNGSIYEGQFYRNTQFGYGQLQSIREGWVYEGNFDSNRRHGLGCITLADGSMYVGEWYYDKIQGKGVMITKLRDIYKGDFVDNQYNGFGELIYSDGSKYIGEFISNQRHGRGIYVDVNGGEYYGNFSRDERDGEFVVKCIVPIEEVGQANYEIKIGLYEKNNLIQWKSKFSNETVTNSFIRLFHENKTMFDSMYAMILTRNLPNLPDGIDPKNKQVQDIIMKLRADAGSLVGQEALVKAQQHVDAIRVPLHEKEESLNRTVAKINGLKAKILAIELELSANQRKYNNFMTFFDKYSILLEQEYLDDPLQTKVKFFEINNKLASIETVEWFKFKNHRHPSVFTKKIMDCISYLVQLPDDWMTQKLLLSDSRYNRTAKLKRKSKSTKEENNASTEEDAVVVDDATAKVLAFEFDCKFAFLMKSYDVINYIYTSLPLVGCDDNDKLGDQNAGGDKKPVGKKNAAAAAAAEELGLLSPHFNGLPKHHFKTALQQAMDLSSSRVTKLDMVLTDPRFREDSYYVESLGVVGPVLVRWIKANNSYLIKAKSLVPLYRKLEKVQFEASRHKVLITKATEEMLSLHLQQEELKRVLLRQEVEISDMREALLRAEYMLKFVEDSYQFSKDQVLHGDYYMMFEAKLERQKDRFAIETCVQHLVDKVESRDEEVRQSRIREALSEGKEYVETVRTAGNIQQWLHDEVEAQQHILIHQNMAIGYYLEEQEIASTAHASGPPGGPGGSSEHTHKQKVGHQLLHKNIAHCAQVVISRLNDEFNISNPMTRHWTMLNGRKVSARFVYVLAWKYWEDLCALQRNLNACGTWETIFGPSWDNCAKMALEARINTKMSAVARKQAEIWATNHGEEIQNAKIALAAQFEEQHSGLGENLCSIAFLALQDKSGKTSPSDKCLANCWVQLNPDRYSEHCHGHYQQMAKEFEEEFQDQTLDICFKLNNNIIGHVSRGTQPSVASQGNGDKDKSAAGSGEEKQGRGLLGKTSSNLRAKIQAANNSNANDSMDNQYGDKLLNWVEHAHHWKSFHVDEYEQYAQAIIRNMASDFEASVYTTQAQTYGEGGSVQVFVEAAKILENHELSKFIVVPEVRDQFIISQINLFNATCYATCNQGLLRKGRDIVRKQNAKQANTLWQSISDVTKNFQYGSVVMQPKYDPSASVSSLGSASITNQQDTHVATRKKLEVKYAWVYGYLCKTHSDILRQIKALESSTYNPANIIRSVGDAYSIKPVDFKKSEEATDGGNDELRQLGEVEGVSKHSNKPKSSYSTYNNRLKILNASIRPSEMEATILKMEKEYYQQHSALEKDLAAVMDKISGWNTYFGYNDYNSSV